MTVYKYFIKLAFSNRGVLLAYTGVFFLLSIIAGTGQSTSQGEFVQSSLRVGIVDNSEGQIAEGLIEYLSQKNAVQLLEDASAEEIREGIFLGLSDAVIIIPEDFEERVLLKQESVSIYSDEAKPQTVQINSQVNKYLTFLNASLEDGAYDIAGVLSALEVESDVEMVGADRDENKNAWFAQYFNFMSYSVTAIYIGVIGYAMNDFREDKMESRRRVSSISFNKFNREIYLGQLTIATIVTAIFTLGAIVIRGGDISGVQFSKYVLNVTVFSTSILCLTYLINSLTNNRIVKSGLSNVIALGTAFISGVMMPQELLGDRVTAIAKFFPTYYFVKINETRVNSFSDISYEISVQLLFAVVFLLVGLYFSKRGDRAKSQG